MRAFLIRFLCPSLLLLFNLSCNGQHKVLKMPQVYFAPDGKWSDRGSARVDLPYSLGAWVVFADRAGIPLLESLKSKKSNSFSEALQPYYVIGEEDSFLLLHTCNDSILPDKEGVLRQGKKLGWARKDKLIMWETALCNKPFGMQRMVFPILNRYENLKPDLKIDFRSSQENQDSSAFFYVVKESPTHYLLSSTGSFKFPYHKSLMGWFPKNLFFEWNSNKGIVLNRQDSSLKRLKLKFDYIKPSKGPSPTQRKSVIFLPLSNQECLVTRISMENSALAFDSEFVRISHGETYFLDGSKPLSKCGLTIPISEALLSGRLVHVVPRSVVDEMKEYYQENLVTINLKDSRLLQSKLKGLFGVVCKEFKITSDDFRLEEFQNFFGKSVYLPLSMRDRRISQLAVGAIEESDIRYFLDGIGKLLASGDNVYDLDFLNTKGTHDFKLFN